VSPAESAALDVFGSAIMLTVPLYFLLQLWLPFRWSGGWRLAALAPLVAVLPALVWSGYALFDNSNLWPVPVILPSPLCFFYLLVLCVLHRAARHRPPPSGGGQYT
jgi:hypothetical protein